VCLSKKYLLTLLLVDMCESGENVSITAVFYATVETMWLTARIGSCGASYRREQHDGYDGAVHGGYGAHDG
jgi:hypothetical protein